MDTQPNPKPAVEIAQKEVGDLYGGHPEVTPEGHELVSTHDKYGLYKNQANGTFQGRSLEGKILSVRDLVSEVMEDLDAIGR